MTDDLNCRLSLYRKKEIITEYGDISYDYILEKRLWGRIIAQGGNQLDGKANSNYSNVSHKIIIREKSVKNLNSSDYFVYKDQVFDIKYLNHNYKYKDRIEVFCNYREEGSSYD